MYSYQWPLHAIAMVVGRRNDVNCGFKERIEVGSKGKMKTQVQTRR